MSRESDDKIMNARVGMLIDLPFFGHLALNLMLKQSDNMKTPTMATDGKILFYDDNFVRNSDQEYLQFMIAHMIGHIILQHLPRRAGRNPNSWNMAADFVTNALLLKVHQFELNYRHHILFNPDWDDKTADWVYTQIPHG